MPETFDVTLIEANHLASMDKSGTSDPYCTIRSSFNRQKFKTKVIKKNLNPQWNQTFQFITSKPEGQIFIKIYDKDIIFKDEFMGEIMVDLKDFSDGNTYDQWFTLCNEPQKKKKDKEPGQIHLRLHFSGSSNKKSPIEENKKNDESSRNNKEVPMANIEEKYQLGNAIGKGAFSVVIEGIRKSDKKKFAIKCISKKMIDKTELAMLEREIDIMKKLKHPHIIQLIEVLDTSETLYLVLEYVSGGELFDAIINKGSYSESDAAKISKQILEAIQYVHEKGIAHRDLKPENLLLAGPVDESYPKDEEGDFIKIADFGLSKDFGQENLKTSCGTPDYVAPEVLQGEEYDMSVDIWSIGVIIYILLCGFPPFYGNTQKELFDKILNASFNFPSPEWDGVSDSAKNFIKKLLVVDPEKRYTAEQALNDPWIQEYSDRKSVV